MKKHSLPLTRQMYALYIIHLSRKKRMAENIAGVPEKAQFEGHIV
jgi:hypothetical protein